MNRTRLSSLIITASVTASFAAALLACGGGQKKDGTVEDLDTAPDNTANAAGNGESPEPGAADAGPAEAAIDAGAAVPEGPAVTIKIKNTWSEDLEFNLTEGWGSRILMFSGKPPKAVSILPFAKSCTASCDAEPKDRCPVCKKPTSLGQIRKAQKAATTVVKAGEAIEVPWDGQVHTYEKTKANRRKCNCHKLAPVAEGSYTVRVCGLRLSKEHRKHSKLQCVDLVDALTFPADRRQVLEADFGDPNPKKKKKK